MYRNILFQRNVYRFYSNITAKIVSTEGIPSSTKETINWKELKYKSKVPQKPCISAKPINNKNPEIKIDSETIQLLERLSLVNLESK